MSDVNLDVSKDSVLESSGLDFGSLGPRFWSLRASILKVSGLTCRKKKAHFWEIKFERPKMQTEIRALVPGLGATHFGAFKFDSI